MGCEENQNELILIPWSLLSYRLNTSTRAFLKLASIGMQQPQLGTEPATLCVVTEHHSVVMSGINHVKCFKSDKPFFKEERMKYVLPLNVPESSSARKETSSYFCH